MASALLALTALMHLYLMLRPGRTVEAHTPERAAQAAPAEG
jgi:hypothetical protein